MPHRDDLEAAHARIAALERELAAAHKENRAPLRCARCRAAFQPDDLERTDGMLTCRGCRAAVAVGRPGPSRRDVPPGFEVEDAPDELRIAWQWRVSVGELLGVVIIAGMLIAFAVKGGHRGGPALALSAVVLGLFGMALAYRVIAQRANRTVIRVSDRRLHIEISPVSMQSKRSFDADEIEQLYCTMGHSKYSTWYDVNARLKRGRQVCLVDELGDAERAFFLEREIERRLGIIDRPVAGEVPRRQA